MSIKINNDFMCLEMGGRIIAVARERIDGWWEVSHWPRFFDRDQAITALMVTELLQSGRGRNGLWSERSARNWGDGPGGRGFDAGGQSDGVIAS